MNIETKLVGLELIDVPSDARVHDPVCLKELAADMEAEGQLQEIIVTPVGGRFEVIAGAGRVAAARSIPWKVIRCSIRENLSEFDKTRITFAENADREDVDPFYQALLLQKMKQAKNFSQRQLAAELGKTEANVSQYLALLRFSPEVQKNLNMFKFPLNFLLQLVRLEGDDAQMETAKQIASEGLNIPAVKRVIKKHLDAQGKKPRFRKLVAQPSKDDPMAANWANLQEMNMNNAKWSVSYPDHEVWRFEIHPNGGDYPSFLAEWFSSMAEAIQEQADQAAKESVTA